MNITSGDTLIAEVICNGTNNLKEFFTDIAIIKDWIIVNADSNTIPFFKTYYRTDKCSSCGNYNILVFSCFCKKVSFCSLICVNNSESHFELCHKDQLMTIEDFSVRNTNESLFGLVGINNIGNTCYMNTAIQCLSHTPQLAMFFLSDEFKTDINKDNQLGSGGMIAFHFAKILKLLHRGSDSNITLFDFKSIISKRYPDVIYSII